MQRFFETNNTENVPVKCIVILSIIMTNGHTSYWYKWDTKIRFGTLCAKMTGQQTLESIHRYWVVTQEYKNICVVFRLDCPGEWWGCCILPTALGNNLIVMTAFMYGFLMCPFECI